MVIAFPCKFQGNGCRTFSELVHKTAHEALCSFRPVSCQYAIRGCTQILLYHLMEKHVLECQFKPPNIQLHKQLSTSSRDSFQNWPAFRRFEFSTRFYTRRFFWGEGNKQIKNKILLNTTQTHINRTHTHTHTRWRSFRIKTTNRFYFNSTIHTFVLCNWFFISLWKIYCCIHHSLFPFLFLSLKVKPITWQLVCDLIKR